MQEGSTVAPESGRERLLTPSKITAWLDCPHYLSLTSRVDEGLMGRPEPKRSSFARLLSDKGLEHEAQCLAEYRIQGKQIWEVPQRLEKETFARWIARIGNPLAADWDVAYQLPFIHNGIRGIADFVERIETSDGSLMYEPVDAKLTRTTAKPGHVLQLCFYADAITAVFGVAPANVHIWLGSGQRETLRINDFQPYWRRLRSQLSEALAMAVTADTVPRKCDHCPFCEFNTHCEQQWRDDDSLIFVANILQTEIDALTTAGAATLGSLAASPTPVPGVRPERLHRLVHQAALQVSARLQERPPFEVITPSDDPVWGHGFEEIPAPNAGDVFLDFEGHPFWTASNGLFFLFGLLEQDGDGQWGYRAWWATNLEEEAQAARQLIEYLYGRRTQYQGMHVYHYNHTERSALKTMAEIHGVAELELDELIKTGAFVDLFLVARNSVQVGTESYGLKHLERLTDFERSHVIDKGAGAVVEFEEFMRDSNDAHLRAIAVYNEDDVRATRALRDWLLDHRISDLPWRDSHLQPPPNIPALDERMPQLHAYEQGSAQFLLGDLLGYWWREYLANYAPVMSRLQAEPDELISNPESIAGLESVRYVERLGAKGTPITPAMRFRFPPQSLERFPRVGGKIALLNAEGKLRTAEIYKLDRDQHHVDLVWNGELQGSGVLPRSVVLYDWVDAKPKAFSVQALADQVLNHAVPQDVSMALLRRDLPRFDGAGPAGGVFNADMSDMCGWVIRLDRGLVAVQGPPGAGKTYTGAHLIRTLVLSGARVGITATSHHAIGNLLEAVINVMNESDEVDKLRAVRKPFDGAPPIEHVRDLKDNAPVAAGDFNLVAGTAWLFSSPAMRAAPVDVMFIDEAGQMALADALAASMSARSLVLLGDPQQLPQVAQALHPNASGVSVLDHVIGGQSTLSSDRGVFLPETWRMHPDITAFISEQFYDGRLRSHSSCARQTTSAGTGLRWIRANHHGNGTSSMEEADLIVDQIIKLVGTTWTNQNGERKDLLPTDFMVVAPYNDQVRLIGDRLRADERLEKVPVGTVDKFQGREAAIVFFSMATSSGPDMTRGADFLFSRNRLNVAISRARCLAYLVCTEELLRVKARTVEDMRLIASLNAFVEFSEGREP